jgi:hypothetical protein
MITIHTLDLSRKEDYEILFSQMIHLLLENNNELVIKKEINEYLIDEYDIEIEVSAPNQKGIIRLKRKRESPLFMNINTEHQ